MVWMENLAVQNEIVKIMRDREVMIHKMYDNEGTPKRIIKRRLYANGTDQLKTILRMYKYNSEGLSFHFYVGSNVIDLKSLNMPKLFKMFSPEYRLFKNTWDEKLGNPAYYKAKNMIWDFDDEALPMKAFKEADKLCSWLLLEGYSPMMVFSGSKGFHVWLNEEESHRLVGEGWNDVQGYKEPHKSLGHIYRDVLQDCMVKATGHELRQDDNSPILAQGMIRCPYSIHPKTGQIVYPLDKNNLEKLRKMDENSQVIDIAKNLHDWQSDAENCYGEPITLYHPPMSKVFNRGMPVWEA